MAPLPASPRPHFMGDRQAARQYDDFVRQSPFYQHLVTELLTRVSITPDDRVLCLAAGTGFDARIIAEAGAGLVVALDRSPTMLAVASERHDVDAAVAFVQADAATLPFPAQSFDVVLMNAAGNYLWPALYPFLADVCRILTPHGRFAFNCQSDEIELHLPHDPQRQLRRQLYIEGWRQGYPTQLSARPSIAFLAQIAERVGLQLNTTEAVQVCAPIVDVVHQLGLPQFHETFLRHVPIQHRATLLNSAAEALATAGPPLDEYRSWHFFTFRRQRGAEQAGEA